MKKLIIGFARDFFIMLAIVFIYNIIMYKLNFKSTVDYSFIIGFMIGWSIWQIIKIIIDFRKQKKLSE